MDIIKVFGDNLKKYRTGMGISQDEYYGAAEPPVRCGVSHLSGPTEPPRFSG